MVWLHGGGFREGSGSERTYNGEHFARRGDVVVVTVNHRLGPLGYLHLGEILGEEFAASGNNGMLDISCSTTSRPCSPRRRAARSSPRDE